MPRKRPTDRLLTSWQDAIQEYGSKNIHMRQLLRAFGYERRSVAGLRDIEQWLRDRSIFAFGLDGPGSGNIDDVVVLAGQEMTRLGQLAASEDELKETYRAEIMAALQLFHRTSSPCPVVT